MEKDKNKIMGFFKELSFNEKAHKYSVGDIKLKSSVSKILKVFVDKVNVKSWNKVPPSTVISNLYSPEAVNPDSVDAEIPDIPNS